MRGTFQLSVLNIPLLSFIYQSLTIIWCEPFPPLLYLFCVCVKPYIVRKMWLHQVTLWWIGILFIIFCSCLLMPLLQLAGESDQRMQSGCFHCRVWCLGSSNALVCENLLKDWQQSGCPGTVAVKINHGVASARGFLVL